MDSTNEEWRPNSNTLNDSAGKVTEGERVLVHEKLQPTVVRRSSLRCVERFIRAETYSSCASKEPGPVFCARTDVELEYRPLGCAYLNHSDLDAVTLHDAERMAYGQKNRNRSEEQTTTHTRLPDRNLEPPARKLSITC